MSKTTFAEVEKKFKRCSKETIEAIVVFRNEGDKSQVPVIVKGIIERYMPAESLDRFKEADDSTPLVSLGIDSLLMLEMTLDIQDALNITIEDDELREMQTMGDVDRLLRGKFADQ